VKPARFSYVRPESLAEALQLLAEHGSDAAILAGGQSLMPMLNLRFARPALIIDIKRVPGLDGVSLDGARLRIGALTRHADVLRSMLVCEHAPLLHLAMRHVAHAAIRNRGTFGGSLALADPAAELPACVVCLEGEIVVASANGERRIPAETFFQGIYATALAEGEMILCVELPVSPTGWSWDFDEVSRRHGDFAMAGLVLGLHNEGDRIAECRIAFCGVEAAPRRIPAVEEIIVGSGAVSAALKVLEDTLQPLESEDYPPAYRVHLAGVLLERALARQDIVK
jgi:carbon-monoxide dehydrogenase medium subunit